MKFCSYPAYVHLYMRRTKKIPMTNAQIYSTSRHMYLPILVLSRPVSMPEYGVYRQHIETVDRPYMHEYAQICRL